MTDPNVTNPSVRLGFKVSRLTFKQPSPETSHAGIAIHRRKKICPFRHGRTDDWLVCLGSFATLAQGLVLRGSSWLLKTRCSAVNCHRNSSLQVTLTTLDDPEVNPSSGCFFQLHPIMLVSGVTYQRINTFVSTRDLASGSYLDLADLLSCHCKLCYI